jgi:hypothetical protein
MSNRWAAQSVSLKENSTEQFVTPTGPFMVFCPNMMLNVPCHESWQVLYRAAYEQAKAALAPSRVQRMLQPSRN